MLSGTSGDYVPVVMSGEEERVRVRIKEFESKLTDEQRENIFSTIYSVHNHLYEYQAVVEIANYFIDAENKKIREHNEKITDLDKKLQYLSPIEIMYDIGFPVRNPPSRSIQVLKDNVGKQYYNATKIILNAPAHFPKFYSLWEKYFKKLTATIQLEQPEEERRQSKRARTSTTSTAMPTETPGRQHVNVHTTSGSSSEDHLHENLKYYNVTLKMITNMQRIINANNDSFYDRIEGFRSILEQLVPLVNDRIASRLCFDFTHQLILSHIGSFYSQLDFYDLYIKVSSDSHMNFDQSYRDSMLTELNRILDEISKQLLQELLMMKNIYNSPQINKLRLYLSQLYRRIETNKGLGEALNEAKNARGQLEARATALSGTKKSLAVQEKQSQELIQQLQTELESRRKTSTVNIDSSVNASMQELMKEIETLTATQKELEELVRQTQIELKQQEELNEKTRAECQQKIADVTADCGDRIARTDLECEVEESEAELKASSEVSTFYTGLTTQLTFMPRSTQTSASNPTASTSAPKSPGRE